MSRIHVVLYAALLTLAAGMSVIAQEINKAGQPASAPVVTAGVSAERVRFTAPSNVVRMQLQVISETGQILFDVNSKGNVLDWSLQDGSGQRLQGAYLTVVTVKSISGRLSERIGTVSVEEKQVKLKAGETKELTAAQQQAVGPVAWHRHRQHRSAARSGRIRVADYVRRGYRQHERRHGADQITRRVRCGGRHHQRRLHWQVMHSITACTAILNRICALRDERD